MIDEATADNADTFIDGGATLDALDAQIKATLENELPPPAVRSSAKVQFRAENEELAPQDTRYVVVAHQNYFPDKNIYTWDEIKDLFSEGIQVAVKK